VSENELNDANVKVDLPVFRNAILSLNKVLKKTDNFSPALKPVRSILMQSQDGILRVILNNDQLIVVEMDCGAVGVFEFCCELSEISDILNKVKKGDRLELDVNGSNEEMTIKVWDKTKIKFEFEVGHDAKTCKDMKAMLIDEPDWNINRLPFDCEFQIGGQSFYEIVKKCERYVSKDVARRAINCLSIEYEPDDSDGKGRFISTDGHRLHVIETSGLRVKSQETTKTQQMIVKKVAVEAVLGLFSGKNSIVGLQRCEVDGSKNYLTIVESGQDLRVMIRGSMYEYGFPDVHPLLATSEEYKAIFHVNLTDMTEGLEMLKSVGKKNMATTVAMNSEGCLMQVLMDSVKQARANAEVMDDSSSESVKLGFNAGYLLEAIKEVTDKTSKHVTIAVKAGDETSPALITRNGSDRVHPVYPDSVDKMREMHLLMPMRLK